MHCEEIACVCVCVNDAIYHDDDYPHYTHIRTLTWKKYSQVEENCKITNSSDLPWQEKPLC